MFRKHRILCLIALSALIASTSSQDADEEAMQSDDDDVKDEHADESMQEATMPKGQGDGPKQSAGEAAQPQMMQISPQLASGEMPKNAPVKEDAKPVGMETSVKTQEEQEGGQLTVKGTGAGANKNSENSKFGNSKTPKRTDTKSLKKGTQQKKKGKATDFKNKKNQQAVGARSKVKTGGAGVKKQAAQKSGNSQQNKKKTTNNANNNNS